MRLRRSDPYGPGIRRVRRGRGFSYAGDALDDECRERIQALAIPPAWRKVWICSSANGHIQAVGIDAAGRRQYLYHEQWRKERAEEKFDRVLELATRLPEFRAQVDTDLARRGLGRRRVEAVALRLLDRGVFRVGGEEYAQEHGTHGAATLLRDQVSLSGDDALFDYPAKGGVRRRLVVRDAVLATALRALLRSRSPSDRLLSYRAGDVFRELHADDVNLRFKELAGSDCSAKDLRTWQGTVFAAAEFGAVDRPPSKRVIAAVMANVADALGNTPAVARGSYVDPRVIAAFEAGNTIEAGLRRAQKASNPDDQREIVDKAVIRLLRRM